MRKLLIVIIIIFAAVIGYLYWPQGAPAKEDVSKHRMTGVVIINYSTSDSPYIREGTYKEVYRKYNYTYKDSTFYELPRKDIKHGIGYYLNEYGDTVLFVYTDYTNYPRRED